VKKVLGSWFLDWDDGYWVLRTEYWGLACGELGQDWRGEERRGEERLD
jgi:hypothetical protein